MSIEYWDKRVEENRHDLRGMIWHSGITVQHQKFANHILSFFRDKEVLDVGCGYGRFAHLFKPEKYKGFDYSPKMIELAHELHPDYTFEVRDYNDPVHGNWEVVFQVISLGSMGISSEAFIEKYKDHAQVIVSLQGNKNDIWFNPSNMDV